MEPFFVHPRAELELGIFARQTKQPSLALVQEWEILPGGIPQSFCAILQAGPCWQSVLFFAKARWLIRIFPNLFRIWFPATCSRLLAVSTPSHWSDLFVHNIVHSTTSQLWSSLYCPETLFQLCLRIPPTRACPFVMDVGTWLGSCVLSCWDLTNIYYLRPISNGRKLRPRKIRPNHDCLSRIQTKRAIWKIIFPEYPTEYRLHWTEQSRVVLRRVLDFCQSVSIEIALCPTRPSSWNLLWKSSLLRASSSHSCHCLLDHSWRCEYCEFVVSFFRIVPCDLVFSFDVETPTNWRINHIKSAFRLSNKWTVKT